MLTAVAATTALIGSAAAASTASASPYGAVYAGTIDCRSANPWPGPSLPILVDVYTGAAFPSDGLPGPAISLSANDQRGVGPILELTMTTTVRWRNVTTGRTGAVRVPTRAHRANWEAVLHPGHGRVDFVIDQKIGAMAFEPMVNPQYSSCRGSAVS